MKIIQLIIWSGFLAFPFFKEKMPPPPGTKAIHDSIYMDIKMVSVADYEEFYFSLLNGNMQHDADLVKCIPDSSIFFKGIPYLSSNAYKSGYPILNLTHYQMNKYCQWRSWAVNLWKNNPGERKCKGEYWDACDRVDPLKLKSVEYFLPDSNLFDRVKIQKVLNIPEFNSKSIDNSIKKKARRLFGRDDIYGFRCVARYCNK